MSNTISILNRFFPNDLFQDARGGLENSQYRVDHTGLGFQYTLSRRTDDGFEPVYTGDILTCITIIKMERN